MNPFTRFLLRRSENRELQAFVENWDALERLVIDVYKSGAADASDEVEYRQVREWLVERYPYWQPRLEEHWAGKRAGGEPVKADPFLELIQVETAAGFARNWRAMQVLPAAREALNELIFLHT